jgi:hypothetical protein
MVVFTELTDEVLHATTSKISGLSPADDINTILGIAAPLQLDYATYPQMR